MLLAAILMASGMAPGMPDSSLGSQARVFKDIAPENSLYPYTRYLSETGIITGFPDGSFRPADSITRAQMAVIVSRVKGLQAKSGGRPTFSDVGGGHWAYGFIEAASGAGLFKGYPDGTFMPESVMTRSEAVTVLMGLSGGKLSAKAPVIGDLPAGHWAYRHVATAVEAGLVELSTGRLFRPDTEFRRGDLARALGVMLTIGPALRGAELTGTLTVTRGKVTLTQGGLLPVQVSGSVKVGAGAAIMTGEDSQAQITFDDGSGTLVESDTELSITGSSGLNFMRRDGRPGVTVDLLRLKLARGKIFGALASRHVNAGQPAGDGKKALLNGERTVALASGHVPPDILLALEEGKEDTSAGEDTQWWNEPQVQRVRVEVDMPWGVAGIRGTNWMNNVTRTGQSTSVVTGQAVVTSGGQTVPVTGGQSTTITSPGAPPAPPSSFTQEDRQSWNQVREWVLEQNRQIQENQPPPPAPAILPPERPVDSPPPPQNNTQQGQQNQPGQQTRQPAENTINNLTQSLSQAISSPSGGGSSLSGSVPAGPHITGILAEDYGNPGLSNGDTVTITFNTNTNQPAVAAKTQIDNLIDFRGKSPGTNYTGYWEDASTLEIRIVDAAGATLEVGDYISIKESGNLKSADNASGTSTASGQIGGSFGGNDGSVFTGGEPIHVSGETVTVKVSDQDLIEQGTLQVNVRSSVTDPAGITITLTEDIETEYFVGSFIIGASTDSGAGTLGAGVGETITVKYIDAFDQYGRKDRVRETQILVSALAQNVSFNDTDPAGEYIGGALTWSAAPNESALTDYVIYYLKEDNALADNDPIATVPKNAQPGQSYSFTISPNTELPGGAAKIGVFSKNTNYLGYKTATAATVPVRTASFGTDRYYESSTNNASNILTVTGVQLINETYTEGAHYSITGLPAGVTATLARTTATTATLTLTGTPDPPITEDATVSLAVYGAAIVGGGDALQPASFTIGDEDPVITVVFFQAVNLGSDNSPALKVSIGSGAPTGTYKLYKNINDSVWVSSVAHTGGADTAWTLTAGENTAYGAIDGVKKMIYTYTPSGGSEGAKVDDGVMPMAPTAAFIKETGVNTANHISLASSHSPVLRVSAADVSGNTVSARVTDQHSNMITSTTVAAANSSGADLEMESALEAGFTDGDAVTVTAFVSTPGGNQSAYLTGTSGKADFTAPGIVSAIATTGGSIIGVSFSENVWGGTIAAPGGLETDDFTYHDRNSGGVQGISSAVGAGGLSTLSIDVTGSFDPADLGDGAGSDKDGISAAMDSVFDAAGNPMDYLQIIEISSMIIQ